MDISKVFSDSFPKPVYIPESMYQSKKEEISAEIELHGYRLVGFREKLAVFSTKKSD